MIPTRLTITNSGVQNSRTPVTIPPLGLLVPAAQTIVATVSTTLGGISTASVDTLPGGTEIILNGGANIYGWDGAAWEDGVNGGPVSSTTPITGEVQIRNPASYDIGITW